jgi:hypothetical protein
VKEIFQGSFPRHCRELLSPGFAPAKGSGYFMDVWWSFNNIVHGGPDFQSQPRDNFGDCIGTK